MVYFPNTFHTSPPFVVKNKDTHTHITDAYLNIWWSGYPSNNSEKQSKQLFCLISIISPAEDLIMWCFTNSSVTQAEKYSMFVQNNTENL